MAPTVKQSIDTLFRLLLADAHAPFPSSFERALDGALAPSVFGSALRDLQTHKVLPLLAYQLSACGRLDSLASPERERLLHAQQTVRALNGLLFLSASMLLGQCQQLGTTPLVLKGLLFADSYYPDPSTRPMGDLDLVSEPDQAGLLFAALERSGFSRVLDHFAQDHAIAFENKQGVSCDAHSYLESYPQADWSEITLETNLQRVRGTKIRTLEPNMMLVHLVDHLHGHSRDTGLVLLWLADIAFVLRKHPSELHAPRIRSLIEKPRVWILLLRVLGLLERHGAELPAGLATLRPAIARLPILRLTSVMRGRRTLPWGLPSPRGFLRILAQRLSIRDYTQHNSRTPPSLGDLCCFPLDLCENRLAELARYRV